MMLIRMCTLQKHKLIYEENEVAVKQLTIQQNQLSFKVSKEEKDLIQKRHETNYKLATLKRDIQQAKDNFPVESTKLDQTQVLLDRRQKELTENTDLLKTLRKDWIKKIRIMEQSLGTNIKKITNSELKNLTMRKVIVINPASKGTKITFAHLGAMRGKKTGILPLKSNIDKVLGKKLVRDVTKIQEFSWNLIK